MRSQRGFTILELIVAVFVVAAVLIGVALLITLGHFIIKFW